MTMSGPIEPPPFPKQNDRQDRRNRVLLGGKIVYDEGACTYDCAIRDLSAAGARLAVRGAVALPKRFHLVDLKSGTAHDCERVWRNATQTGVKFHATIALSGPVDPALTYLKRLYVEARPR